MNLLPSDLDKSLCKAVKHFWTTRSGSRVSTQEGNRGAVIGGKTLDGFTEVIRKVAKHCGYRDEEIFTAGKNDLVIPGFFRPSKIWDVLVISDDRLIAVFELKSQVGSFGNNFNNRAEEAIGSATDLWTAFRENAFSLGEKRHNELQQPFLGFLMLLERSEETMRVVKTVERHYQVFPEFKNTSYVDRYEILCRKLILEQKYDAAALIVSDRVTGEKTGAHQCPNRSLSPVSLLTQFAGHLLAAKETWQ